jgi:hypothetical protein
MWVPLAESRHLLRVLMKTLEMTAASGQDQWKPLALGPYGRFNVARKWIESPALQE